MKQLINRVILTGLCVMSCAAMAETGSFERETIKTGARGTTTVSVNQDTTLNGWTRDRVVTNPNGRVAERHTEVDRDPVSGVVTRSVDGTLFNGKTYSKDSTRTPTDSGFIKQTTQVTPNGKTREKLKVVERSRGQKTVDVTRVNGRGQVSHRVTRTQRTK
ncbi:MAG: hypothetical protein EOO68_15195 [Moraxellaceae bacterium]|jgi:hypothetical protein|nr:MAG: hypothetical protein EOO68_15195 [Moraxellaceae bacterium]